MLVVTPNLCFDRTLRVERFEAGAVVRPYAVQVAVGGKGVNVVRAVTDLGGSADLLGLVGDADESTFTAMAAEEGVRLHPVVVAGQVRQATIVLEDTARASVLNEAGPTVDAEAASRLLEQAERLLSSSPDRRGVLACSGSLPPGLPTDCYGRLAALARDLGGVAVVDGARAALADALPYEPDLVTPNLHEAEALLSGRVDEASHEDAPLTQIRDRAFAMGDRLRGLGARRALVTAGAHGAAYVDARDRLFVAAPPVRLVNPIGAGDALVGGLVDALARGADWIGAVRRGVAVASAAVEHPVAGHVDAARADELEALVGAVAGVRA